MNEKRKAVVLLSGGIDSSTTLAVAKNLGFEIYAISFKYGQRHQIELESAKELAKYFEVKKHMIFEIDMKKIIKSALTSALEVPKERSLNEIGTEIPTTYVPARNIIFLSIALGWAETTNAYDIFIGANAVDYSGYPDCRPEFVEAFQKLANLATKTGVEGKQIKVHAPLISLTKGEIIKKGIELGVDYSLTHSCYDPSPNGEACGRCDSCLLRKKGFKEAGIEDPIEYASY
jgi:7-cyano-7-deazaguanine synthase